MTLLLRRFGLLLLTYSLLRLGFHFWNAPAFVAAPVKAVLSAYARGIWFDYAALCFINIPWLALTLLLPPAVQAQRGVRGALLALWLGLNVPFIGLNLMDYAYYGFINRRSTDELFTLTDDIRRQAPAMVARYWFIPLLIGLLAVALAWAYARVGRRREAALRMAPPGTHPRWGRVIGVRALVAVALGLGLRGSLGLKPLRVGDAFTQQPAVLGNLTLNSTFTFLKALPDQPLERRAWFPSLDAARAALDSLTTTDGHSALRRYDHPAPLPPGRAQPNARPNVVLLIVESFASEFTGIDNGADNGADQSKQGGYTPFFDSLATAPGALFFRDHYANGHSSIEAVPSVLMGFPPLIDEPLITSTYQANTATGLPDALRAAGYRTAFFHGANNGSMGFRPFTRRIGVEQYFGVNEYPGATSSSDYDGTWGILDEPYLQYFGRQIGTFGQPFFATLFTLSSHEPYPVPARYAGRFPKGTLPIHAAIGYTDFALRRFFAYAQTQPWYANTLFVLLADHAQQSDRPGYQNVLGLTKTPLLLFRPGARWPALPPGRITQQADIPATILDYAQVPAGGRLLPYGTSVLDSLATGRAWVRDGGSRWLIHQDFVTELTADQHVRFYQYATHQLGPPATPPAAVARRYETEIKAAEQFTNNGLIDNALYIH